MPEDDNWHSETISVWSNPNYTKFWIGQTVSNLGNSITALVLPLMILDLTGSALQVTVVSALQLVPYALLGIPAGAYLDNLDRKSIMKIADLIRFFAYMSIPASALFAKVSIYQIYLVTIVSGICTVFHSISGNSSIPHIVGKEHLGKANSYYYTALGSVSLIGPAIGGILYKYIGGPYAITIDALSFLLSFILLALINVSFQNHNNFNRAANKSIEIAYNIKEGFLYIINTKIILKVAIILVLINIITGPYFTFVLVFSKNLGAQPQALGFLFGVASIGGIIGPLWVGRMNISNFGKILIVSLGINVLSRLVMPFSTTIYPIVFLLAMVDFSQSALNVAIITFRQSLVPDRLLARVNSVFRTLAFSSRILGNLAGGLAIVKVGAFAALLSVGVLFIPILIYSLAALSYPS